MKKRDFLKKMNYSLQSLHLYKGHEDSCNLVPRYAQTDYAEFLEECFPEFNSHKSINSFLLRRGWYNLKPRQKTAIYFLRVALITTFTAWAIKTKSYRNY